MKSDNYLINFIKTNESCINILNNGFLKLMEDFVNIDDDSLSRWKVLKVYKYKNEENNNILTPRQFELNLETLENAWISDFKVHLTNFKDGIIAFVSPECLDYYISNDENLLDTLSKLVESIKLELTAYSSNLNDEILNGYFSRINNYDINKLSYRDGTFYYDGQALWAYNGDKEWKIGNYGDITSTCTSDIYSTRISANSIFNNELSSTGSTTITSTYSSTNCNDYIDNAYNKNC